MILRTPRRRISPRTKRRYQAIKNFLRRALGSSSQPNIPNNYSTSVSVSELKQKIVGIEKQINTVSEHCQNFSCFEYNLEPTTNNSGTTVQDNVDADKDTNTKIFREPETTTLYTTQDRYCKRTRNRPRSQVLSYDNGNVAKKMSENKMTDRNYSYKEKRRSKHYDRLKPIQECEQGFLQKSHSSLVNVPAHCSVHSLKPFHEALIFNNHPNAGSSELQHKKRNKINYLYDMNNRLAKENNIYFTEHRCGDHRSKNHRNKHSRTDLDQDFITEIIRRQYKPVKLFGRRDSDFSQFSAPVCRDQEFPTHHRVQEESELCSCCHNEHKLQRHSRYMCSNDLSDMRSICDTRLYSSRKHKHHTNRKKRIEDYNDSAIYDIVPVKEKSSPKSRRKFVEDNMLIHDKYRVVPPSPRTQRPRLNLQAQLHTEDDEYSLLKKQLKHRFQRKIPTENAINHSNISSEVFIHNGNRRGIQNSQSPIPNPCNQEGVAAQNCLQYPMHTNQQPIISNDTTLNTQTTDMSADKTDKTLSEIKDILQSFLLEIKKESSQSDKLISMPKSGPQKTETQQQVTNTNVNLNDGHSFNNNNSFAQCVPPFMQSLTNPCCYPIFPVCPMNCMANGYVVPSQSCTCAAYANHTKEQTYGTNDFINKPNSSEVSNNETQKLIKEIHKLVLQNPNSIQRQQYCDVNTSTGTKTKKPEINDANKILTSKSSGSKLSKHDAKVGTSKMKSYSKSCEAIGSQIGTDIHYAANVSYSDTVLDKPSGQEQTTIQSSSEEDYSSESAVVEKKKENKFAKVLRSIGLLKRNKNAIIEDVCESSSSLEVRKPKSRPPFQQHIMNYNMHGQEYFYPPMPPYPLYDYCGHPCHNIPRSSSPTYLQNKVKDSYEKHPHLQDRRSHCASPHHMPMPCPYYDPQCGNVSPQVPLCLKEIEVKSIGTQSVRKISLLEKFANKIQAQKMKDLSLKQNSTETTKDKPGANMFDWKKLQTKAMQSSSDPLKFSYKTQKRLAEGDIKMRNAMLKKLFYKRNPFSPRNLLVRTLLGKDRSSFGEPPKLYKPRMFM